MTTSVEKTIYLCNGTRKGIVVDDTCKGSASNLSIGADGTGVVQLVPKFLPPKKIDIKLLRVGDSVNNVSATMDKWEMVADSINNEPPYWASGVRLSGTIPMACDWQESRIKSTFGNVPILTQNPLPREIPDSIDQVLPSDKISTITTSIIPGEAVWTEHSYRLTGPNGSAPQYFRTIAMIGGTIKESWPHPAITGLYYYDVEAEGIIYTDILPTDYYQYSVGDWVFVLTLTPVAVIRDRDILTPSIPAAADQLRIAPYKIAGRGQYPNIKSYAASDFVDWSNLRILYGIILDIVGDVPPDNHQGKTNIASVRLTQDDTAITGVPIKYWCQSNATDNSCHAFDPGDVVLVAFDGYRENPAGSNCVIIGHAASVYPCTTTTTTTTSTTTTTTTTETTSNTTGTSSTTIITSLPGHWVLIDSEDTVTHYRLLTAQNKKDAHDFAAWVLSITSWPPNEIFYNWVVTESGHTEPFTDDVLPEYPEPPSVVYPHPWLAPERYKADPELNKEDWYYIPEPTKAMERPGVTFYQYGHAWYYPAPAAGVETPEYLVGVNGASLNGVPITLTEEEKRAQFKYPKTGVKYTRVDRWLKWEWRLL